MHRDLQGAARVAIAGYMGDREKSMLRLKLLPLALVFAMAGAPVYGQTSTSSQKPASSSPGSEGVGTPGCHFGEKVDNTTVDDVQRILIQAGYTSISGLAKGCDNFWHRQAMLNGVLTNVMVTPDGRIVHEGT
jgi:hypothetical protein